MSTKTIYTCDFCKKSQEDRDQFWYVGLAFRTELQYENHNISTSPQLRAEVCRSCMEKWGLLPYAKKVEDDHAEKMKVAYAQTLAEKLEAVIQELVERTLDEQS